MDISVIIPTFNRKDLLKRALDSVCGQTFTPYEVIVVDDGSSDGTLALQADYPDVVFVSQENRGVSAARNNGVAKAHGEWICFLDSDDLWKPRKLEIQKEFHETN
ncbi:MAG: glycosyltransferase family 2 protein, partial [Candidatus Omnitrophica bacterium]|nr:glycosyltransferase family 2 protein [Candidatus Omnitrophota bacterium]